MKKTLYTFLVWNFLLFVAGLSDIVFYRNLTSVEGMTISWTQPALVSITSFLILLSIYYGMHHIKAVVGLAPPQRGKAHSVSEAHRLHRGHREEVLGDACLLRYFTERSF